MHKLKSEIPQYRILYCGSGDDEVSDDDGFWILDFALLDFWTFGLSWSVFGFFGFLVSWFLGFFGFFGFSDLWICGFVLWRCCSKTEQQISKHVQQNSEQLKPVHQKPRTVHVTFVFYIKI